jgi:hypothetical protein
MNKDRLLTALKTWFTKIDWLLLCFLLLVLDIKLAVKIAAIVLVYLVRPDFRFSFRLRSLRDSKLPVFYFCMPVIAVLDWLFRHQFDLNQDVLLLCGLFFWGFCILIAHQLRLFADKGDPEKVHRTITLFFFLNFLVSVGTLVGIMITTGAINPYTWTGEGQTYFISTGDHIQGIMFDFSLTNALINAMGVIYFIFRRQFGMVIACMCVQLLAGSNLTNLLIGAILVFLFFYKSSRARKITTAVCLLLMVFFMKVVSPENKNYAVVTLATIAGHNTIDVTSQEDTNYHISKKEVLLMKKAEVMEEKFIYKPTKEQAKYPGKMISYQQTIQFMLANPWFVPLGTGAGHFSSKLAFRASSLGTEGGYPARFTYIDPNFQHNHLAVFLYYFTKGNKHHSIIHTPFSVLNQMLGEYGLAGLAALALLYFGFFIRRSEMNVYRWLMLGLMAIALCTDYWFEQLSIVIIFELLWFVDIRQPGPSHPQTQV